MLPLIFLVYSILLTLSQLPITLCVKQTKSSVGRIDMCFFPLCIASMELHEASFTSSFRKYRVSIVSRTSCESTDYSCLPRRPAPRTLERRRAPEEGRRVGRGGSNQTLNDPIKRSPLSFRFRSIRGLRFRNSGSSPTPPPICLPKANQRLQRRGGGGDQSAAAFRPAAAISLMRFLSFLALPPTSRFRSGLWRGMARREGG